MLLLTVLSFMAFGSHESRAEKNSEPAANEDKKCIIRSLQDCDLPICKNTSICKKELENHELYKRIMSKHDSQTSEGKISFNGQNLERDSEKTTEAPACNCRNLYTVKQELWMKWQDCEAKIRKHEWYAEVQLEMNKRQRKVMLKCKQQLNELKNDEKCNDIKKENENIRKQIDVQKDEIERIKRENKILEKEVMECSKLKQDLKMQLQQNKMLKKQNDQLKIENQQLENNIVDCQKIKQQLKEKTKENVNIEKENENIKSGNKGLKNELKICDKIRQELDRKKKENTNIKNKNDKLKQRNDQLKKEKQSLGQELEECRNNKPTTHSSTTAKRYV